MDSEINPRLFLPSGPLGKLCEEILAAAAHPDWHARYFMARDYHFNAEGNRLMFQGLAKHLL